MSRLFESDRVLKEVKRLPVQVLKRYEKMWFVPARKHVTVSVGESLRILRELQGWSQATLSRKTGIPQSTLSGIETGRIRLGAERTKVLARALQVHPAAIPFPGWDPAEETRAS